MTALTALQSTWCNRFVRRFEAEQRAGGIYCRDASGGDVEAWLPLDEPPAGVCPFCWDAHKPSAPHNVESAVYRLRFEIAHGRPPTVADALAHCPAKVRAAERKRLSAAGLWLVPPLGVPIIAELGVTQKRRVRGAITQRSGCTH